jgi:hypothetical protein
MRYVPGYRPGRRSDSAVQHRILLTDEVASASTKSVLGKVFILHEDELSELKHADRGLPPDIFYISHFVNIDWRNEEKPLDEDRAFAISQAEVESWRVCGCWTQRADELARDHAFSRPLRALDPFAGCGAFALGLEQAGVLNLTHAVEIDRSAARTLK